ncbi:MAG: seg [Parcubacteria group bacterium]|nr:seg [Parcubacteria group bacterium]
MNRRRLKLSIKISVGSLFLMLIFGYSLYQSRNLFMGPVITISEPKNGSTAQEQLIKIAGTAKNIKKISLDDRPIYVDESGVFSEKLLLSEGYNVIKISAWDKFNKKTEKTIELVYKMRGADNDKSVSGRF